MTAVTVGGVTVMNMTRCLSIVALGVLAGPIAAHAAIVINAPGGAYAQNFDSLATSGTANAWANDSTLPGWTLAVQPSGAAPATYRAGAGTDNTGAFYSFGTGTGSDRALGGVGSGGTYWGSPATGAIAGWIAAAFMNASSSTLDGFSLAFTGEQWRNGGNETAQTMVFEYGFGSTFGAVSTWSAPGGLFDWTSPIATATAGALDGNAAANRVTGLGGSINALTWNPGDTLWLRWIERNDLNNDHGLAIDDLRFTAGAAVAPAVPLPAAVWLLLSGLAGLGLLGRRPRRISSPVGG